MGDYKLIPVENHSVTFYGGKAEHRIRAVIVLYNSQKQGAVGCIKFYKNEEDVPEDGFDNSGVLHVNFPVSMYMPVLHSVRSGKPFSIKDSKRLQMGLFFQKQKSNYRKIKPIKARRMLHDEET